MGQVENPYLALLGGRPRTLSTLSKRDEKGRSLVPSSTAHHSAARAEQTAQEPGHRTLPHQAPVAATTFPRSGPGRIAVLRLWKPGPDRMGRLGSSLTRLQPSLAIGQNLYRQATYAVTTAFLLAPRPSSPTIKGSWSNSRPPVQIGRGPKNAYRLYRSRLGIGRGAPCGGRLFRIAGGHQEVSPLS